MLWVVYVVTFRKSYRAEFEGYLAALRYYRVMKEKPMVRSIRQPEREEAA